MYYVRAVKRVVTKRYFNVCTGDRHERRYIIQSGHSNALGRRCTFCDDDLSLITLYRVLHIRLSITIKFA